MSGYIPYMDDNQGRGASEPIREDNREYPRSYSGTHSREGRSGYDQDKHVRRMSSRFNKEFKKRRHYDKKHEEYTSDTPHDCIRVEMCEFYPWENAQEHNTHMYEIVYNEPNRPVYRRGLTFKMTIWFKERPFEPERDNVRLVFNFGPNPSVPKETKIFLPLTSQEYRYDDDRVHNWEANIVRMDDRCMDVEVYIPPDAPVGVWRCWVETCPEGFSYYYRDGSQYHPSSYRRSRRDCSPWRSGPSAFRGEEGSTDRWDWAPFYRDDNMYNYNNRRRGDWDRWGYRDGSWNRWDRRNGSWDRWGSRDASRDSWDWAPFYRTNSPYWRNSSPYRRDRRYNSYDNNWDRQGYRYGSWNRWGSRNGSWDRWNHRDNSYNRRDCRDGSGNRWNCQDGSYDSWDWAPFYRSYSPYWRNNRSRSGSFNGFNRFNDRLNRRGRSWDQWGSRNCSWDRSFYRNDSRDRWDWAPFNRDSSFNRRGYRNGSWDQWGRRDGSWNRFNRRGRSCDLWGKRGSSWNRFNGRRGGSCDSSFYRRNFRNRSWDRWNRRDGSYNRFNRRSRSYDQWGRRDGSYDRWSRRGSSFDRYGYRDGSWNRWNRRGSSFDRYGYRDGSFDRWNRRGSSFDRYGYRDGSWDRWNRRGSSFDRYGYRDGSWGRWNRRGSSFDRRRDGSWDRSYYRDGSQNRWDWAPFYRDSSPYYRDNEYYRGNRSWYRDDSFDNYDRRDGSFDSYYRQDGNFGRFNRRDGSWNRWNRRCSSFDRFGRRDGSWDRSYYRDGSRDRWDWAPFYRDNSPYYRDNKYYRGNRSFYRDDSYDNFDRQDGSYDSCYRRGRNWNNRRDNSPYRWDWAPYYRYGNNDWENDSYYGDQDGYCGDDYNRNRYYNRSNRDGYFGDDYYRNNYDRNDYHNRGDRDNYWGDNYYRNGYYNRGDRYGYRGDDYYRNGYYNSWDDDWCGRDDDYWRYRRDGYWYDRSSYYNEYPYGFNGEVFKCKQDVYILFNPWCRDDPTYMDDEMWRQEYVLNDTGKIWVGSYMQNRGRRWVYGQFDDVVLPAVMYLLEEARMSGSDRSNPIRVVRAISEMVNNQDWNQQYNNRRRNDQQGNCLMMGRWDGKYDDGVSPYNWTGSVRIMEQYLRTGKPVKYGQCWVYAGVATTICRALGIPCRPVTNFTSAHDTNNTMSVDKYFSVNGDEIERGPDGDSWDSVWSFHCWNEVWMDRPDLPSGYGGWQAIDCTYQEESDGRSRCGPASLECIRSGEIGFNYDTKYLFTEINAEINHWQQDEYADHGFNRMRPGRYCVGREILTKRPDYDDDEYDDDCMDVIYEYKPRDWHFDHDRIMNSFRGMEHGYRTKKYDRYFSDQEDVLFEMEEMPMVYMGQPFMVQMHMINRSNEPRSIEAMMSCHSMYYNGVKNRRIQQNKEYFVLPPNQEETFMLRIMPEDYEEQMVDFCMMKIYCIANVKETRQAWGEEEDFYFQKPRIHIQTSGPQQVDQDFEVNFGFTNPLDIPLTNCRFSFEGPGLQRPRTIKYRDVRPGEMVSHIERFVPKQPGETKIVATFTSHQLNDVFGSRTIGIRE